MQPDLDALCSRLRFKVNHHTKATTQHNLHRLAYAVDQRQQFALARVPGRRARASAVACSMLHLPLTFHAHRHSLVGRPPLLSLQRLPARPRTAYARAGAVCSAASASAPSKVRPGEKKGAGPPGGQAGRSSVVAAC